MTYTQHGHQIPGSPVEKHPPTSIKRCGGPGICMLCSGEVWDYTEYHRLVPPMNVPDNFQEKAKRIVINYIDANYSVAFEKPAFEVYIVWFAKVLQHWKALLCTDQPDKKYYELTYNGDRRETYVDEYVKVRNTVVPD